MLSLITPLKAIFFDLDNVLVFSEPTHYKAWQQVIQRFDVDPNELHFHSMIGLCDKIQSQQFIDRFGLKVEVHELWQLKKDTYLDMVMKGLLDAPVGRDPFLAKVSQSYITGVVSSNHKAAVHQVLKNENIASYFDFVISHEDCVRHKPDPLPYLNALSIAQVEPHEALVIEDSVFGITAAQKAAIPVIGLFKDQSPDTILQDVQYFNDFNEVNDHLFPA